MRYYRCRCGKSVAWSTGGEFPQACVVCEECGSTLASHPDYHAEPIEHEWEVRYDQRTGKPFYEVCDRCGSTRPLSEAPAEALGG